MQSKESYQIFSKSHSSAALLANVFLLLSSAAQKTKTDLRYLENWDTEIDNLSLVDDYATIKEKIRKSNMLNGTFSKGNYVAKILLGGIVEEIDQIDKAVCRVLNK